MLVGGFCRVARGGLVNCGLKVFFRGSIGMEGILGGSLGFSRGLRTRSRFSFLVSRSPHQTRIFGRIRYRWKGSRIR